MKKTLIISALLVGSLSAYSQGTVTFADRLTDMTIHIYAPQLASPGVVQTGQANAGLGVTADVYLYNATDANVFGTSAGTVSTGGSTVYTGGAIGNTRSGNATPAGAYNYNVGADYTVQLWAAPGLNALASALAPVTQYTTTILTSSTVGGAFKNLTIASDPGIANAAASATIALVAWYNGGTGMTLAQAQAAADPWGMSLLDNLSGLGGSGSPPASPPNMEGLESFSLATIPEPSTIALGVIGASAFLFRRRK